jgi:hypothetical protein
MPTTTPSTPTTPSLDRGVRRRGHNLQAGHDTALAITAIRLARRQGVTDLAAHLLLSSSLLGVALDGVGS